MGRIFASEIWGLTFGRAYLFIYLFYFISFFMGGRGRGYDRNFTVYRCTKWDKSEGRV